VIEWQRAHGGLVITQRCGSCGQPFKPGDPVAAYVFGRHKLLRCETCHGSPAPPDLPELIVLAPVKLELPFVRFTADMLPLDWRSAAAQPREPGEDD
jgi:hypothetical protein